MLELLLQGLAEWIHSLAMESWEYFSDKMLEIMSLDFEYMKTNIPVIETFIQMIVAVGWALLIGNLVFQAIKSMISGLGFDGEDPKLLFARSFVFGFLLLASPQICELGLDLTSRCMEYLNIEATVDIHFVDRVSFGTIGGAWLLVIIFDLVIMFKVFKLLLEIAERYVVLNVLTICAPLAFATGGSKNTADIFTGWCRMFGSMCLLMVTNVIFLKMLLSLLSMPPMTVDIILWMIIVLAIVKVAHKADAIIMRIGLNPAPTGGNLGQSLPGMLAYTVMRTAASSVVKSVGKGPSPQGGTGGAAAGQNQWFHAETAGPGGTGQNQGGADQNQGRRSSRTRSSSATNYQNNQGAQQNTAYAGAAETSTQQEQRSSNTVIVGNAATQGTPSGSNFHGEVRSHGSGWQPESRPGLAGIHSSSAKHSTDNAGTDTGKADRQTDLPSNYTSLAQTESRSSNRQTQTTDGKQRGSSASTGGDQMIHGSRSHGGNARNGTAGKPTSASANYSSMRDKQPHHNNEPGHRSSTVEMRQEQSQQVYSSVHSENTNVVGPRPTGTTTGKTAPHPNVIPMGPGNTRSGGAANQNNHGENSQGRAAPAGSETTVRSGREDTVSVLNGTRSTKARPEPPSAGGTERSRTPQPDSAGTGTYTSGQQSRETAAQERSTHVPPAQANTPLKSGTAPGGAGGGTATRQSYAANQREPASKGPASAERQSSVMRDQVQHGPAGMPTVPAVIPSEGKQSVSTRQERPKKISGKNVDPPAHLVHPAPMTKAQGVKGKEVKDTGRASKRKTALKGKSK